jgi:hypothetical protein
MIAIRYFCPTHRKEIDPQIEVDKDTFMKTRLRIVRVFCPHCDRVHRFLMADSGHELIPESDKELA